MLLVSNAQVTSSMLAMSMSKVALAQAKRLALLTPWPCTPERLRMLIMAGLRKSTLLSPQGLSPTK